MVVDHERVVLRLKEHILTKRSHSTAELAEVIARLEVECEVPEGEAGFSGLPSRDRQDDTSAPADGGASESRAPAMAAH